MNILMLNFTLKWRSTFFRAFHFARCLTKLGHRVTVLTISTNSRFRCTEQEIEGVRVIETPAILWGFGRTGWDLWDMIWRIGFASKNGNFDLIHGFDCRPTVLFPSLYMQKLRKIPYVSDWADWWGRGGIIHERKNKMITLLTGGIEAYFEEGFRQYASGLTVTSTALRERAISLGLDPEWVFYIPSGADIHSIVPMDIGKAREKVGLEKDGKIVAFMGFVLYDLELAIRSFSILRRTHPDVKLLLVGPRAPITAQLRQELDLTDQIIEVGIQPHYMMSTYLGCADVLLLPYSNKIWNIGRGPIKLGDYLASGRPTVTNPVGDIKPLFTSDRIGMLSDDSPESFAEQTAALLDDPVLCREMGENARKVAEEKCSWETFTENLEKYYYRVIEHKSPLNNTK